MEDTQSREIRISSRYSVLMTVYLETKLDELDMSIGSMMAQTVMPDQFVLVMDGPVDDAVLKLIESSDNKYSGVFTILSIKENHGLAYALNEGLKACRNELVARMDSDDFSLPDRCALQLKAFANNPKLALLGTLMRNFTKTPNDADWNCRKMPLDMAAIRKAIRRYSPFVHPSVMYKKSAVISCKGYDPRLRRRQDYDLFSKMINRGFEAANLNMPLLLFRADINNRARNKNKESCYSRMLVQKFIYKRGDCSIWDLLFIYITMVVSTLLPVSLYEKIYSWMKTK